MEKKIQKNTERQGIYKFHHFLKENPNERFFVDNGVRYCNPYFEFNEEDADQILKDNVVRKSIKVDNNAKLFFEAISNVPLKIFLKSKTYTDAVEEIILESLYLNCSEEVERYCRLCEVQCNHTHYKTHKSILARGCIYCDSGVMTMGSYRDHVKSVHPDKVRAFFIKTKCYNQKEEQTVGRRTKRQRNSRKASNTSISSDSSDNRVIIQRTSTRQRISRETSNSVIWSDSNSNPDDPFKTDEEAEYVPETPSDSDTPLPLINKRKRTK